MALIQWNEEISVGIEKFDNEHKQLIAFINKLDQSIRIGDPQSTMETTLSGLIDYTKKHFQHEETMMEKHSYADYENHKKQHIELTDKVEDFYQRYKSGKTKFTIELMNFLRDWIIDHIMGTDKKYKDFFQDKEID